MPKKKSREPPVRINPYSLPIPKSDPAARAARAEKRATMNTTDLPHPKDVDENGNPRIAVVDPHGFNPVQPPDLGSNIANIGSQRGSIYGSQHPSVHSTPRASQHGTPRASQHGS